MTEQDDGFDQWVQSAEMREAEAEYQRDRERFTVVTDDSAQTGFRRSWRPVDLSAVLSGDYRPPEPTVGVRTDGVGTFYPGKCHTVSSESEGGKTWFALAAVIEEMKAGRHALYVDFEDDEGGAVGRLLTLQVDRELIRERFHYLRPEDPLGTGLHRDDLLDVLTTYSPTIAVLDGVTEALTVHGLEPNSNADVAEFGRKVPRFIASFGPATVSLDHVTKSSENRGRYSIGAIHKLNGLDGAAYVLENRTPFGIGLTGRSTIRIAKDRPGQLRRNALPGREGMHWYGDLVLDSHAEGWAEIEIAAPEERAESDFRPTVLMGRIMAAVEKHGPMSKRRVRAAVQGKATTVDNALELLILDGYLTEATPHSKLKEWPDE